MDPTHIAIAGTPIHIIIVGTPILQNLTPHLWPQLILKVGIWLKLGGPEHIQEYVDFGHKDLSHSFPNGCWSYK